MGRTSDEVDTPLVLSARRGVPDRYERGEEAGRWRPMGRVRLRLRQGERPSTLEKLAGAGGGSGRLLSGHERGAVRPTGAGRPG